MTITPNVAGNLALNLRKFDLSGFDPLLKELYQHDKYTYQHSVRVGHYMQRLGERLSLSSDQLEEAYLVGLLHDIGKLRMDKKILQKRSMLSTQELELMRAHPKESVAILKDYNLPDIITNAILHHHENLNGTGYYAVEGANLSLYSKMIRIVDSYDAMTSNRAYRTALPIDAAVHELQNGEGAFFDHELLQKFIATCDYNKRK